MVEAVVEKMISMETHAPDRKGLREVGVAWRASHLTG